MLEQINDELFSMFKTQTTGFMDDLKNTFNNIPIIISLVIKTNIYLKYVCVLTNRYSKFCIIYIY